MAEADHYSHIAHCKNVEPWWWKANPKGFGSLPSPWSGYATIIMVVFAHLLILEYSDHHQNLISSSLYYPGPLHKIAFQSVHNFLSNVVHRQTNRQTNATKNTRSTQRAQTSLAEADHYSHIAHCKNVEPWWWKTTTLSPPPPPPKKKKKKSFGSFTCATIWVCHNYYGVFLLIYSS